MRWEHGAILSHLIALHRIITFSKYEVTYRIMSPFVLIASSQPEGGASRPTPTPSVRPSVRQPREVGSGQLHMKFHLNAPRNETTAVGAGYEREREREREMWRQGRAYLCLRYPSLRFTRKPQCENLVQFFILSSTRPITDRGLHLLYLCSLMKYIIIICLIWKLCMSPFIWDMAAWYPTRGCKMTDQKVEGC